jgi:RIP homotypic interaction motif
LLLSSTEGLRMESVTLILTALAAGASAGALDALKDDAKDKAKATYAKLRGLVSRRFRGNPSAEIILSEHQTDPETYAAPLAKKLTEARAGVDAELIATAKALMEIIDQAGAKSGKYNVTIKDSKGVQVGDGNVQVNNF